MVEKIVESMAVGGQGMPVELGSADGGDWGERSQDCRMSQERRSATILAQWSPAGITL